jgi:asparagine synthase (glutamine-hydrolysing)
MRGMLAAMRHRGPDDEGLHVEDSGKCALAHTRLAIIDVTPGGHQPMSTDDGRFTIVFNGEIYNYLDVRRELQSLGIVFRTQSDTEVLLEAFAAWGAACVTRLRGMFAFAVWDRRDTTLTLVRDRLGIKPLYYAVEGEGFWFASEVRTLLASGHVPRVVDRHAIAAYLDYGSFQQPHTVVERVKSLLPGHIATIRNASISTSCYWSVGDHLQDTPAGCNDYRTSSARLREMLESATRLHMVADVPVGAFLSGGIDSRLVVGLMTQVARTPIKTFTVAFERGSGTADERLLAARTANDFGCQHTELVVQPSSFLGDLEGFLESVDCPSADGFNTYVVARAAREAVTVVLSGLGGDELFAGYQHFARLARAAKWLPRGSAALEAIGRAMVGWVPGRVTLPLLELASSPSSRLRLLRRCPRSHGVSIVHETAKVPSIRSASRQECDVGAESGTDVINVISVHELTHYLPNTLLRDGDVMSMRHGLEMRPLLLDHLVVENALSLPGGYKYREPQTKAILIDSCRDLLPAYVTESPKLGFETPVRSWASTIAGGFVKDALIDGRNAGLLSSTYVASTITRIDRTAPLGLHDWAAFLLSDYIRRHALVVAG